MGEGVNSHEMDEDNMKRTRIRSVSMVQPASCTIHCQSSFNHHLMFMTSIVMIILFTLIPSTFVDALRNPYEVLGVKQSASITEIKYQYKQLVRNWHPDKNSDPEAESKFIEINKAYEVSVHSLTMAMINSVRVLILTVTFGSRTKDRI